MHERVKSVSYQLCGIEELHFEIRMAGIDHLDSYPNYILKAFPMITGL